MITWLVSRWHRGVILGWCAGLLIPDRPAWWLFAIVIVLLTGLSVYAIERENRLRVNASIQESADG